MTSSVRAHPLMHGAPPKWASSWGQDRFGVFAGFAVNGVEMRMRWIEGGRFVMGSPEDEEGRFDDETQHDVEVSGFWLGETPVTQALWQAVTGENPSEFQSPDRPVEQVSWDQCQAMIAKLNGMVPGLAVGLPSEAQWEYACRAGTSTATYAGVMKILGENNAPVLDRIAWYGGNSGVGFELSDGWDCSDWPKKQYPHKKAGTRPVAMKLPNDFGLYDMLGNVWEWCEDWKARYPREFERDPRGPRSGVRRVLRGGAWLLHARDVRAANRLGDAPGYRSAYFGVRLSQGQGELGAEPQSGQSPPARARGTRAEKRGRGDL